MNILETGKTFVEQNASTILTGIGMAGVVLTAVTATNATIKAVKVLEGNETKTDVVKKTWKYYIPPVVIGGGTMACIFMANKISLEKIATVTAIYSLNEKHFANYKDKVKKVVGEAKEEEVKDLMARESVESKPFSEAQPIDISDEETLCFDMLTGRYFKSSIDHIKRVVNDLNHRINQGEGVTLNDLYYGWGLSGVSFGDEYGWGDYTAATFGIDGLIEPSYSSQMTDTGRPCFAISLDGMGYLD